MENLSSGESNLVRQKPIVGDSVTSNTRGILHEKNVKIMTPPGQDQDFQSEMLSDSETSEFDPNKVNVPVSTILLSFDLAASNNPAQNESKRSRQQARMTIEE